jgi:hypothetical protein
MKKKIKVHKLKGGARTKKQAKARKNKSAKKATEEAANEFIAQSRMELA